MIEPMFVCVSSPTKTTLGVIGIKGGNSGSILTVMLRNVMPISLVDEYTVFEEISVLRIHFQCLNTETGRQCMPQWRRKTSFGTRTK